MDYLKQPISFKLRKALRYARLYGPSRTYIKIVSQKRRKSAKYAPYSGAPRHEQTVALIGCGNYCFSNIAYYLTRRYGAVIRACMDRNIEHATSISDYYKIPVATTESGEIFDDPGVRLVYVASNHSSHAEYAIRALGSGKDVYIEKPHVTSLDQLKRLIEAIVESKGRVSLGFNRPYSRFGEVIRTRLNAENGPGMYNWSVAGHEIEADHWYLKPEEGGRVLGNLCHWTDFLLRLIPEDRYYPIRINPTSVNRNDSNIIVTFAFGDDSVAVISFSEKGHAFEGVREHFTAHKGDCVISMSDFQSLTVDVGPEKRRYFNWYRDHGHERNILAAFRSTKENQSYDREKQIAYIWNTGLLFLKTKEALESNSRVTIDPISGAGDQAAVPRDRFHAAASSKS